MRGGLRCDCGGEHPLSRPGEGPLGQLVLAKLLLKSGRLSQAINLAERRIGAMQLARFDELQELFVGAAIEQQAHQGQALTIEGRA